jgi:hypothetical protein
MEFFQTLQRAHGRLQEGNDICGTSRWYCILEVCLQRPFVCIFEYDTVFAFVTESIIKVNDVSRSRYVLVECLEGCAFLFPGLFCPLPTKFF